MIIINNIKLIVFNTVLYTPMKQPYYVSIGRYPAECIGIYYFGTTVPGVIERDVPIRRYMAYYKQAYGHNWKYLWHIGEDPASLYYIPFDSWSACSAYTHIIHYIFFIFFLQLAGRYRQVSVQQLYRCIGTPPHDIRTRFMHERSPSLNVHNNTLYIRRYK